MKRTVAWIDNLKGIAIIAVVIGHIATPITKYLYSWHIPLFFFVSGLLIKRNRSAKEQIKRDIRQLFIPFLVFSIVGLIAEYIKRWIFPQFPFVNGKINLWNELIGIFWWMDYSHLHQYGFVLWFLPALFWAKNIYLVLFKYFKESRILTAFSLTVLFFVSSFRIFLPFCLDKGLIGLFWVSCFWLIKGKYWLFCLLLTILLPVSGLNIAISTINLYGILYSVIAINAFVGVSKKIHNKFTIFEIFGNASMLILIIHPYINNICYWVVSKYVQGSWIVEAALSLLLIAFTIKIAALLKIKLENNNDVASSFIKQIL